VRMRAHTAAHEPAPLPYATVYWPQSHPMKSINISVQFRSSRHLQVDMYIEMHSDHEKSNLPSRQRVTRVDEEGRTAAGT
jgi:hypothetical protein